MGVLDGRALGRLAVLALALGLAGCALPRDRPLALTLRVADPTASHSPDELDVTEMVLEKRLDQLGVGGTLGRPDDQTFLVRLPGDADAAAVGEALTAPGVLEFVDPQGTAHAEGELICTANARPAGADCATVYATIVSGIDLDLGKVALTNDQTERSAVAFGFVEPAATALADFTDQHVGRTMTIALDGRVISSPVIQDRLPGEGIITFGGAGDAEQQARRLVSVLKNGVLPVALEVEGVAGQP